MPNAQLDQLMQTMTWKLAFVIILGSIGAFLLRELLQWIDRRAMRVGQSLPANRGARSSAASLNFDASAAAPRCPSCNGLMVKRTARRPIDCAQGRLRKCRAEFWGCFGYPRCRGTRAI